MLDIKCLHVEVEQKKEQNGAMKLNRSKKFLMRGFDGRTHVKMQYLLESEVV